MVSNKPCGFEGVSDRGWFAPIPLGLGATTDPSRRDGVQDFPTLGSNSTLFMDDLVSNRPLCA
jgi:hypothetical protein